MHWNPFHNMSWFLIATLFGGCFILNLMLGPLSFWGAFGVGFTWGIVLMVTAGMLGIE